MLKLLIPVLCRAGALEAVRHAAFLFAEKRVAQVELIEVLEDVGDVTMTAWCLTGWHRDQRNCRCTEVPC